MKVIIVGVGSVGRELAEQLERQKNNELVLIDSSEERCEELADKMDALVLHGDGTDPEILQKAQISEADALVAITGGDALNTVIAMLGHRYEVKNIIVRLKGVGLRSACQEIGVRKIIAPKIAAAAEILSTLYGPERVDFSILARQGLRLIEFGVGKFEGDKLGEVELPDGAHIVAVLKDDEIQIPRSSIKLQTEDQLLILVENEKVHQKIKAMLSSEN